MLTSVQVIIFIVSMIRLFVDEFLRIKNNRHIAMLEKGYPSEIVELMTKSEWADCLRYTKAKAKFSRLEDWLSYFIFIAVLVLLIPWYYSNWPHGANCAPWLAACFASIFLISMQMPELFFDWFRQFRIEEKLWI